MCVGAQLKIYILFCILKIQFKTESILFRNIDYLLNEKTPILFKKNDH